MPRTKIKKGGLAKEIADVRAAATPCRVVGDVIAGGERLKEQFGKIKNFIPPFPSMPQIPTEVCGHHVTVPSLPSLPSLPSISLPSMPAMPEMPALPSLPSSTKIKKDIADTTNSVVDGAVQRIDGVCEGMKYTWPTAEGKCPELAAAPAAAPAPPAPAAAPAPSPAPPQKKTCNPNVFANVPCDQIKKLWREQVRYCHSDKNPGIDRAKFQELNKNHQIALQRCLKQGGGARRKKTPKNQKKT